MSDLRGLYQEVILDHSKRPRNFRALAGPSRHAEGYNPLCGDRITLYVKLEGDRIADIAFEGSGCAISTASASLLTETLKGKSRAEVEELFGNSMISLPARETAVRRSANWRFSPASRSFRCV
jgi:nitrogen fixation NifU-like protein